MEVLHEAPSDRGTSHETVALVAANEQSPFLHPFLPPNLDIPAGKLRHRRPVSL